MKKCISHKKGHKNHKMHKKHKKEFLLFLGSFLCFL
jgi:hypothetical protein